MYNEQFLNADHYEEFNRLYLLLQVAEGYDRYDEYDTIYEMFPDLEAMRECAKDKMKTAKAYETIQNLLKGLEPVSGWTLVHMLDYVKEAEGMGDESRWFVEIAIEDEERPEAIPTKDYDDYIMACIKDKKKSCEMTMYFWDVVTREIKRLKKG